LKREKKAWLLPSNEIGGPQRKGEEGGRKWTIPKGQEVTEGDLKDYDVDVVAPGEGGGRTRQR